MSVLFAMFRVFGNSFLKSVVIDVVVRRHLYLLNKRAF